MKVYYMCYSNAAYEKTKKFSIKMARKFGRFNQIISYSPDDIDKVFFEEHRETFLNPRGNGLWLWKPYLIYKTLCSIEDGDCLFYCDAGAFFIRPYRHIVNNMKGDIWLSDLPLIEKQFTKPEVFQNLDCTDEKYYETNQIQATFMAFRKTEHSLAFVKEWLNACCNSENISPNSNLTEEMENNLYEAHREDQSILSLLAKKHNVVPQLDPSQYGRVPQKYNGKNRIFNIPHHPKEYPPCIILHRTPNADKLVCFKQWIFTWLPIRMIHMLKK